MSGFLSIQGGVVFAQQTYFYQTFNEPKRDLVFDGKPINSFSIEIDELKNNQRVVRWRRQEGDRKNNEVYVLDPNWSTIQWQVTDTQDKKEYTGRRTANQIAIKGVINGKSINRKYEIDSDPFYFNPKLGLRHFVESGKKTTTFWAMRHDKLTVNKMTAEKNGTEKINVNGQKMEATQVTWSALTGYTQHFKRTYWFRASDQNYVKQKVFGRRIRVLVREGD